MTGASSLADDYVVRGVSASLLEDIMVLCALYVPVIYVSALTTICELGCLSGARMDFLLRGRSLFLLGVEQH